MQFQILVGCLIQSILFIQLWTPSNSDPIKGQNVRSVPMTTYSYVVVIFKRDDIGSEWKRHCSGSLISFNHVLTAGKCLAGLIPSNLRVIAGTTEIKSTNHKSFDVRSTITFREWSKSEGGPELDEYSEDVGIIQLTTDDTNIRPGRIDYAEKLQQPGGSVRLIGWGSDHYNVQSWIPKGAVMEIQKENICRSKVEEFFPFMKTSLVSKRLLCVSSAIQSPAYGADADFGGPFIAGSKRSIIGILVQPCPINEECRVRDGQPNMMLRLQDFGKFIYHNVRGQTNVKSPTPLHVTNSNVPQMPYRMNMRRSA